MYANPAAFIIPGTTPPQRTHPHQPAFALVLLRHNFSVSRSVSLCIRGFTTLKSSNSVPVGKLATIVDQILLFKK